MKKKKLIIIIFVIVILTMLVVLLYSKMINSLKSGNVKINTQEIFAKQNKESIFKIDQIILYSNVDVVDESEKKSLQDLSLSQYTDIAISIDNTGVIKELTEENTIKELYIDNIQITTLSSNGEKVVNYKNPYMFGKYRNLEMAGPKIRFNILNSNSQNLEADYDGPTFYADCSNPISLGYINKNVVTDYYIKANDKSITFDGAILERANIGLDVLNNDITFCIHIINNLDEEFVCNVCIDNNLENEDGGLYTGYIMKIFDISEEDYKFIKMVN